MERWVLLRKGADFEAISKKFHISPRPVSYTHLRDIWVECCGHLSAFDIILKSTNQSN